MKDTAAGGIRATQGTFSSINSPFLREACFYFHSLNVICKMQNLHLNNLCSSKFCID